MAYDFNLTQIDNTDTFKEWADKCNAIIDGLNTTDFVTSTDSVVTVAGNQTITGLKTFQIRPTFRSGILSTGEYTGTGDFTNDGNFTFNGGAAEGIINTPTFKVNSGSFTTGDGFQVIGSKGISFKSSSTSSVASLKFENAGTPEKIVFDYTGTGEGTFEIADGNKLSLAGSSPTIGINSYEWDLPATSPGTTPSYLKWVGSGSAVSWFSQTDLASAIVTDVRDLLAASNFTLPVTLIPVGTMIAVDARILDSWAVAGSPEEYTIWSGAPGWLVCNGQTLSYDENSSPVDTTYQQLVELLEGIDSPNGSTTLPDTVGSPGEEDPIGGNSIVYLIKYKEDATTAFAISSTTGVAGAAGINLFDTTNTIVSSFDIEGGKIGLNINTDDFEFGVGGELSLVEEIATTATANTLAKRDSGGTLAVGTPTSDEHATTKAFVDTSVVTSVNALEDKLTNELKGSVRAFPELLDGHQSYSDGNTPFSMSFVDKYGRGVFHGRNEYSRGGGTRLRTQYGAGWFNAFSPITDQEAVFERTFIGSRYNFFFIDNNDILYGTGRNEEGAIGQQDRGTGVDFTDYYTQYHGSGEQPYNDTGVETPVPAMLPQKEAWDANAITVDTVSYTRNPVQPGILVKTKDGVGREYVSDSRLQGFVKYETDENAVGFGGADVPYTRGWLIISSENDNGNIGNGTLTATNYSTTGPQVFGLNSAGSSLWATFAVTDTQRANGINTLTSTDVEKVNKRFHYFKENATKAGGLDTTDGAALLEWKSQLGFDPAGSETFAQYSYYIKKSVIEGYGTWLIIGKPGNESDNEIWFAGYSGRGQAGNGKTDTTVRRHVPALDFGTISTLNIKPVEGTDNKVYKSHDANSPEADVAHGFEDFEQISIGTARYYIIRGDENNQNLTTRFRLFLYETNAYDALVGGGTTSAYRNAAISSSVLRHHQKLKGIFDISVGSDGASAQFSNYVLARRTTDTTTSATALDSLPESEFSSVTVMSWGENTHGQLGLGNTNNASTPQTVSVGTADRPVDIIAVSCGRNSFIVTENGDDNRSIRIAGDNFRGLADVGTQTGNTTTFTLSSTIDANWWVKKVFVSAGPTFSEKYLGYIFIVAQSKTNSDNYALFAGGYNNYGQFGTAQRDNLATLNYIRIPFPENPKNIVSMQNVSNAYYALCKTEESGETAEEFAAKSGRVYGSGLAAGYLSDQTVRNRTSWHPIDGQILST